MSKKAKVFSLLFSVVLAGSFAFASLTSRVLAKETTATVDMTGINPLDDQEYVYNCTFVADENGNPVSFDITVNGFGENGEENGGKMPTVLAGIPSEFTWVRVVKDEETGETFEEEYTFYPKKIASQAFFSDITKVYIPEGVNEIAQNAFSNYKGLVQVNFPSTISIMGSGAFQGCVLLEAADLSNTGIQALDSSVFSGCSSLRSALLPDGLLTIGPSAFASCTTLTSMDIPSSVVAIDKNAFSGDTLIESFDLKEGLRRIEASAFSKCEALTEISIPSTVTSIGSSAFSSCKILSTVNIPDGTNISSIGESAFANCALKTFTIPASCRLYSISKSTFANNTKLTRVTILTDSVATFYEKAFSGCSVLEYVDIYTTLSGIGKDCFSGCAKLDGICNEGNEFLENVKTIGAGAFAGCESLTYFEIPDVLTISDYTFDGCKSLATVPFRGTTLNTIGRAAFRNCESFIEISLPDSVTSIGEYAFQGCKSMHTFSTPRNLKSIAEGAFKGCESLREFDIPDAISSLYPRTFEGCLSLTEMTIPSDVIDIPDYLFNGCTKLATVTMGDEVETIGAYAFAGCTELGINDDGFFQLPLTLTSLGTYAFNNCTNLKDISIPTGITTIPSNCFSGCTKLSHVELNMVKEIGDSAFNKCSALEEVNLPNNLEKLGKSSFAACTTIDHVFIPDTITDIPATCFSGCTSLEYVLIPESVTSIGGSAFSNCDLIAVEIPDSLVMSITSAFSGNKNLNRVVVVNDESVTILQYLGSTTAVVVPSQIYEWPVTEIADMAYFDTSIKSVVVPETVTNIGSRSFGDCVSLQWVRIPKTTDVPDDAFEGCASVYQIVDKVYADTSLNGKDVIIEKYYGGAAEISLPTKLDNKNVVEIGKSAFEGNYALTSVSIPKCVVTIGARAFKDCYRADIQYPAAASFVTGDENGSFAGCKSATPYGTAPVTPTTKPTPTQKPTPTPTKKTTPTPTPSSYTTNPLPPTNLKAVAESTSSIKISWTASKNVSGYQILRATSATGSFSSIGTVTATNKSNTGLGECRTYYYKVRSYSQVGGKTYYSEYSSVVSATTKLTVPTNLSAAAESTTAIKLTWNRVSGATGYQVWRSTASNGTYVALGTFTTTSKVSSGLNPGSMYYYKIRTVKEIDGKKFYSDYTSVVSAVTKLAKPAGVKAVSASSTSIKLSWNKVTGAAGYQVWKATAADGTYTALGSGSDLSRVSSSLTCGSTYYYKVRAYAEINGKKYYGDYSAVVSVVPKPLAPTNLKVVSASATSLKLTWSKAAGATGYQVWRATSSNGTYTSIGSFTELSKVSSGLTTGCTYYYKVRAYVEKNGTRYYGDYSSVASGIPVPAAPTGVKAARASATSIKITWNKVSGATGYQVFRSTSATSGFTSIGSFTETSKVSTGLKTGTTYYYKVRAYTEINGTRYYSNYSTVVSAVPTK